MLKETIDQKIQEMASAIAMELAMQIRAGLEKLVPALGSQETEFSDSPRVAALATARLLHSSDEVVVARDHSIRPKQCVAPNCDRPNGGPRSGYCCPEHKKAPKKTKENWRAAFIHSEREKRGLGPSPLTTRVLGTRKRTVVKERDQKIVDAIRKQGKAGATTRDVAEATGFDLGLVRSRINRMLARNALRSKGTTSNVRYFVT